MAKFQPTGLEWMNKGLKEFNKEIKEVADLMARSANDIDKATFSMKNLNKESGEWIKRTANVVAGTEGVTVKITEMTREIDDAGEAIITTDRAVRVIDGTTRGAGRRGGGIGVMTAAISGLSAAVGLFLLNAIKNLVRFGLKALWQALILPIKGFIELGKVVAKVTFAGFKAAAELAKNVLMGIGEAAAWAAQKILDVGKAMLTAGVDFQEGFTGIKKAGTAIVDAAGNITALGRAVREDFIDLIREIPLLPEEILRIGELGAQLDIPDEALAEFSRVVAAITKATVLSTDDAALGMGKISSVMGLSVTEFERMGSVLVWLGNNMGIVEDEILLMSKRITGVAKTAGFTTDEVLAISAAFLRLGATPYAGASAVQQAVTRITIAVAEGGDDLALFAAVAGMSSDQFVDAWEVAPADAFLEFIKGLTIAEKDAVLLLDELGLANIRVTQSFLSAAAAPEELIKAMEGSRQAWEDNTALAREAQLRYETIASKIQLLKNQFSILGTRLFDFVLPIIQRIIGVGDRLIGILEPGMLKAFERLSPLVEGVSGWFDRLGNAIDYATDIGESIFPTWEGFTRLILDLLGLDPSLAGPLLETIQDIIDTISDLGEGIDTSTLLTSITTGINTVIGWVIENWPKIKTEIGKIVEWFEGISWESIRSHVSAGLQTVIDLFVENWPKVLDAIEGTVGNIMDFLFGEEYEVPVTFGGRELGEVTRRTGGFIEGFVSGFDGIRESAINLADTIMNTLIPALQEMVQNLAIIFGMDAEEAFKDPVAAGEFLADAISKVIDKYADLLEIISFVGVEATRTGPASPEQVERTNRLLEPVLLGGEEFDKDRTWLGKFVDWWNNELPTLSEKMPQIWVPIEAALLETDVILGQFLSGFLQGWIDFFAELVGNSIIPEGMAAIVAVFESGLAEISTLWSTFWTGTTTEASTGVDSFLTAMGVEPGGSSQGLLATIERSYSAFKDAGRGIVRAIADGMIEAAFMMVDAMRENIDALNVAVDTDEAMNNILADIGYKIVKKIADAIYDSYVLIYEALELALSLGGQLISGAAAEAQRAGGGGGDSTVGRIIDNAQQAVTAPAGVVTPPAGGYGAGYTPAGLLQPTAQGEAAQINITNYVRDDMDLAAIESSFRRIVAEEIA